MQRFLAIVVGLVVWVPCASGQVGGGDAVPAARILTPLESATAMIERLPHAPGLWQRRADVHRFAQRMEAAHADLTTALRLRPGYERARLERALVRREIGRFDEALEDVRVLLDGEIENRTRRLQALELEASIYIAQRDWARASGAIERATEFDAERGRLPWLRARVLLARGDEEAGMAALVEAWESNTDVPVWAVVRPVTPLERAVIFEMRERIRVPAELRESPDDVRVRAWFDEGSEASIERLYEFASTEEGQAAGARGLVAWAQHCAHVGRDEEAARAALSVYLSGATDDQRLMALMVFLRTASAEEGGDRLALVESGARDERFAWALPTLRALHAVRAAGG